MMMLLASYWKPAFPVIHLHTLLLVSTCSADDTQDLNEKTVKSSIQMLADGRWNIQARLGVYDYCRV